MAIKTTLSKHLKQIEHLLSGFARLTERKTTMCKMRKFDYMSGYMSVDLNGNIECFSDDCPLELKEKVLKEWPAYKKEVEELHKKGYRSSEDWF